MGSVAEQGERAQNRQIKKSRDWILTGWQIRIDLQAADNRRWTVDGRQALGTHLLADSAAAD